MNILLIKANGLTSQNPAVTPPVGLMYLASFLMKEQPFCNIKIVDTRVEGINRKKLDGIIGNYCPDVVAISALTMEAQSMYGIAETARNIAPDCKIVVGGPQASLYLFLDRKTPGYSLLRLGILNKFKKNVN